MTTTTPPVNQTTETPVNEPVKLTLAQKIERAELLAPISGKLQLQLAKRDIDEPTWNTLKLSLYPGAKDDSILMLIDYCKVNGLDMLRKPAHIVPMNVKVGTDDEGKAKYEWRDVIMPGIAHARITATRTAQYLGSSGEEFGPEFDFSYNITDKNGKVKETKTIRLPEWCRYTVRRLMDGQAYEFVGPRVYFVEAYATKDRYSQEPNAMWAKRPRGQLAKCAEAAALRMAFPEQMGNEHFAEEMEGQQVMRDVTPAAPAISAAQDVSDSIKAARAEKAAAQTADAPVEPVSPAGDEKPIDQDKPGQSSEASAPGEQSTTQGE